MIKSSKAANKRAWERQQAELPKLRADLDARLLEAYRECEDRTYAEEFWGEILRERGITF